MNLPIIVLPKVVEELLDEKNPGEFEREEMAHLFGILLPGRIDGKEMIVLTHAYQAPGITRSFANVNTNSRGVRDSLQIINNGLTITSSALGLVGSTVGTWHTHPSSPNTGPSYDDVETYRKSARTSGMGFWLGPIACRHAFKKYTKWLFYAETVDRILEIPEENIVVADDKEVFKFDPGLQKFLLLKPEHFLRDVSDADSVFPTLSRSIKPSVPIRTEALLPHPKKPMWFEVMAVSSFGATIIIYALFALYLSR